MYVRMLVRGLKHHIHDGDLLRTYAHMHVRTPANHAWTRTQVAAAAAAADAPSSSVSMLAAAPAQQVVALLLHIGRRLRRALQN